MSLSLSELQLSCNILNSILSSGRVQEVRHPSADALILQIRVPRHTYEMLVHIGPGQSRICITSVKWPNAPIPTGFVSKLRKELVGAKLLGIVCSSSDRLVTLQFSLLTKDKQYSEHILLCELSGHHANVFLVDPSGMILTQMLPSHSHKRTLRPGYIYERPMPTGNTNATNRLAETRAEDISTAIESLYSLKSAANVRHDQWNNLLRVTNSAIRKMQTTFTKVLGDAQRASGADELIKQAELVKTVLPLLRKNIDSVTVTDWYDPELKQVVIPLNPTIDPQANVAHMFHQAKRLKAARNLIDNRLSKVSGDLDLLKSIRQQLLSKEYNGDLDEETHQLRRMGLLKAPCSTEKNDNRTPIRQCYREFITESDHKIWVGKSATDNDTLTVKFARSHDIWLHATGRRGAHVVLRIEKNQIPEPQSLADAALLAAHYCEGGKNDSGVEVAWTYRKYVRKVKHSAPGTVTYSQAKTIWVTLDSTRLSRLFGNHEDVNTR